MPQAVPVHTPVTPGSRYGRLVAVEKLRKTPKREWVWRFICDCGASHTTKATNVLRGRSLSCGCGQITGTIAANTRHGEYRSPEYRSWECMIQRCENPNTRSYHRYGGRGITVCDRWRNSFENFLADMGKRPHPKDSIDRIDNDKGYEPGNCRWANSKEQSRNRGKK